MFLTVTSEFRKLGYYQQLIYFKLEDINIVLSFNTFRFPIKIISFCMTSATFRLGVSGKTQILILIQE